MRAQWLSFLGLGLALTASACSSDPVDDGGQGVGSAGTGGEAGAGGEGGGGDEVVTDACTVTADLEEAALAEYTVGEDTETPGGWAEICGRGCLPDVGTPEYSPCVSACIMEKTDNALTDDCARCLVIPVECAVVHCLSSCVTDTPECTPCLCTVGEKQTVTCIQEYTDCSGLTSDTCDGI